jgi:hypothetical protein
LEATTLTPGKQIKLKFAITEADQRATPYYEVPILLQDGVTRLDVLLEYAKSNVCVLDLGILDSTATKYPTRTGFRGWSGGARSSFYVGSDDATPGYYAGPMPAGEWNILIGLYKIPPEGVEVMLSLKSDAAPRVSHATVKPAAARRDKAGWYRGDLHCHTYHSDAGGAPKVLVENARSLGLDFLAVTDHNTTSQWQYFGPNSTSDLVFVPGMEITTYRGHANIFGLSEWIDFRLGGSHDLDALVQEARRQGALISVNHDKEPLLWNYDYPDMDCMEVYHGHWLAGNDVVLDRYDRFLSEGRRISLIGGSDYHQTAELQPEGPVGLGKPTTVLWLPHLDAGAVVNALRSGHGYVTESPSGPHLVLTVNNCPMGSTVRADGDVEICVEVSGAAGDRLVWVSENGPIAETVITSDTWQDTLTLPAPNRFIRAEIIAEHSRETLIQRLLDWYKDKPGPNRVQKSLAEAPRIRRALSNPVYFGASDDS